MTTGLGGLGRLRRVQTRSISPENFDGAAGGGGRATEGTGAACARTSVRAGRSRRASRSVRRARRSTLADHRRRRQDHPHLDHHPHRQLAHRCVLRAYWDGADEPAVEVPYGDFFCNGWGAFAQVNSQPIAANPHGGFNSYWPMPFRSGARADHREHLRRAGHGLLPGHLRDRRRPLRRRLPARAVAPQQPARGRSCRTRSSTASRARGTTSAPTSPGASTPPAGGARARSSSILDGDDDFPTICGTGTEDYFGGAWNFDVPGRGLHRVLHAVPRHAAGDPAGRALRQPAAVRHVPLAPAGPDPLLRAASRVDIQALGWRSRLPLPAAAGRHRLDRVLLPRPPGRTAPGPPTADVMEIC